jgi:hypothetical protein
MVKGLQDTKPEGTELARRAWLEVGYAAGGGGAQDISGDISKYFLSATITDNLADEADDVSIELEDRAQVWMGDWYPEGEGNVLDLTIHTFNRVTLQDGEASFHAGKYEIDEIEVTGYPSTVRIKAVSIVGNASLRGTKKNQTWEGITVKECAGDICGRNGLSLRWECDENPTIDHMEQDDKADLEFLRKVCHDHGMSLKILLEEVVIFDEPKYESQPPVFTVYKPGTSRGSDGIRWLTEYRMRAKTRDVYWKCHVSYQKGKDKKLIEGEFAAPDKEKGRTLHVREQVEDQGEAERLAKKKLREANKEEVTGHFTTVGNTNLAAGQVLALKGFGHFDGNYLVTKVTHEISESYTTSVEIRKCLKGY